MPRAGGSGGTPRPPVVRHRRRRLMGCFTRPHTTFARSKSGLAIGISLDVDAVRTHLTRKPAANAANSRGYGKPIGTELSHACSRDRGLVVGSRLFIHDAR
jgi:hypothetical protein